MSERGMDAGSVDQSDAPPTDQCSVAAGESIKPESVAVTETVKSEFEAAETKMPVAILSTSVESDANNTAPSDLGSAFLATAPAADVGKQDVSDAKAEDPALKEEDDALDNDDQNADGKQSAQYWNYHWPKVCRRFYN